MTTTTAPRTQDLSEGPLGMALLGIERADLPTARRHLAQAAHPPSIDRDDALNSVITAAGLGAGVLPAGHRQSLSDALALALADTELGPLLQDDKAVPGNPPEEVPQPT